MRRSSDPYEKHKITQEELKFLQSLQKEMNTQDSLSQADPRFWVIRDYEKVYGESLSSPDGIKVYDDDTQDEIISLDYSYRNQKEFIDTIFKTLQIEYNLDDYRREEFDFAIDLNGIEEAILSLVPSVEIYEYQQITIESGFFLTQKAADKHLKENRHHYSPKAHTFAKTAWRSEEEPLWDILHKAKF